MSFRGYDGNPREYLNHVDKLHIDKETLKQEKNELIYKIDKLKASYEQRLKEVDELLWEEKIKEASNNVGRCFMFRTTCSGPRGLEYYWDTFYKIIEFRKAVNKEDSDGYIIVKCYKNHHGLINIEQYYDFLSYSQIENYEEISSKLFDEVYNQLVKELVREGNDGREINK